MAILAKKIHIKNSAGTEQTVNLYSTTGEVATASGYTFQLVDGVTAYAPLVSTNHAKATSGRVLKGGTTYAWGSAAPAPAYSSQLITTAGSGTFTVPSGVSKLRVTCVGGGAGGCSGFLAPGHTVGDTSTTAVGGTATTFGSVTAAGGTSVILKYEGYTSQYRECGSGREASCWYETTYHFWVQQGSTGYNNGTLSTSDDVVLGGAAVPLTNYKGTQVATAGSGGYADSGCYSVYPISGGASGCRVHSGASGYRTVTTVNVTSGQKISYTVGAGGKWCSYNGSLQSSEWNSNGHGGSLGGTGAILIEWGSGIE